MEKWLWTTLYGVVLALTVQAAYDLVKETFGLAYGWSAMIVSLPLLVILLLKKTKDKTKCQK